MRVLDDCSIFLHQKATLFFHAGAFSMYDAGIRPQRSHSASGRSGLLESQGVYCDYLIRSEIREFYLQRRIRQRFLSLEYIYSGEFYIRNGETGYLCEPGDLFLLHPGMDHDLMFLSEKKCRKLGCILSGWMLPEVLKAFQLDHVDVIHLPDSKRLDDVFDRILETFQDSMRRKACERNAGLTFELLQMLANVHQAQPLSQDVAEILDFFEEHCSEEVNMRHLAERYGMTLPTLNKRFRSALHMTPYQYLIKLRMHRAVTLLQTDAWAIKEIAEMCGYRNALHFSSEFHRTYGCSPREYRKKLQFGILEESGGDPACP